MCERENMLLVLFGPFCYSCLGVFGGRSFFFHSFDLVFKTMQILTIVSALCIHTYVRAHAHIHTDTYIIKQERKKWITDVSSGPYTRVNFKHLT